MNNFPRLLISLNQPFASDNVFVHLGLEDLLSHKTKKILKEACSREEITLRQNFFHELKTPAMLKNFEEFLQEAYTYQKWRALQDKAPLNLLYPLYTGRALFRMIECLKNFESIAVFSNLRSMLTSWETEHKDFSKEVGQCLELLKGQSTQVFAYERARHKSISFTEPILLLSETLKVDLGEAPTSQLPEALLTVYLEDSQRKKPLAGFRKKYAEDFPGGIELLLADCEFFAEINRLINRCSDSWGNWCFPEISSDAKFSFVGGFNVFDSIPVIEKIENSFHKKSPFTLIRGINSGGKTMFLKLCAAILLFGSAGCPIPCKNAEIPLYTSISTIFADAESWDDGRFETEKQTLAKTLQGIEKNGILLINELYSSTKDRTAVGEIQNLIQETEKREISCIFVTHFEIPHQDTLFAGVDEEGHPTYKITDDASIPTSYTKRILENYGLHKDQLNSILGE